MNTGFLRSLVRCGLPVGFAWLFVAAWVMVAQAGAQAMALSPTNVQSVSVFINEIHYDNAGADVAEGVEIAGPAGFDLNGWQLVAYNGSNSQVYDTLALTGILPDLQNGYGTLFFALAGLQNGSPDGLALIAPGDVVVQFLSYEGEILAVDGPAAGMTSQDIGVAESGTTPISYSLQLTGRGRVDTDFTWAGPFPATYNAVNEGQTLADPGLDLTKSAPPLVALMRPITYTLSVTNSTGITLGQITLTDTLPANTAFLAASDGGVQVGEVISWSLPGGLAPGQAVTRSLAVIPAASGWITNSDYAVVAANWLTPTRGLPVVTRVAPLELGLAQTAPPYAVAGETIVYEIILSTQGVVSATQLTLTDTLPGGATYLADTSGVPPITDTGCLIWSLPDLPPNTTWSFSITIRTDTDLTGGTSLANLAEVQTDVAGDDPANNTASATTLAYPLRSLYEIQAVPATDDTSPYAGQVVWVEGVVVAEPGEIGSGVNNFVIAHPLGGAWNGLMVYQGDAFAEQPISEGAFVRMLGEIAEYNGMTEINIRTAPHALQVLSVGNQLLPPVSLQTSQFVTATQAEAWESVLIQFDAVTITGHTPANAEWTFENDGISAIADDFGRLDGDLTFVPVVGEQLSFVRGVGWYAFGEYQLQPRRNDDIARYYDTPLLTKTAPAYIGPSERFTYTLTLANYVGYSLTGLVITDALPANCTLAAILDGGTLQGETLTWHIADLPDQAQVSVRFAVTATQSLGAPIWNAQYSAQAANYPSLIVGTPRLTVVGAYTPISLIQGSGQRSPLEGQVLTTQGVVVGLFEGNYSAGGVFNGFFLQDAEGDGNPATSDGIFIHSFANVQVGDWLAITGTVREFDEYDGAACPLDCLTEIRVDGDNYHLLGHGTVTPTLITPLGDPAAGAAYFESLEGMLTNFPMTATVVGPTSYGAVTVIPSSQPVTHVLRHSPQEGMPFGVRHWLRFGGSFPPELIVGSVIEPFAGPFTWSFGGYMVVTQPGEFWTPVYTQPLPTREPAWPAPSVDQFSVATFNTYNFDTKGSKLEKVVRAIRQMNGPTILALQEISPTAVMADFIGDLAAAGYPYEYAYSPASHGISVALLWRSDVITQSQWATVQGCSPDGSTAADYDPLWDTCRAQGMYPTFPRRPVVLTATLTLDGVSQQIVVIANHLKSKLGGEPSDRMRLAEAEFLAELVDGLVAQGQENVIVLGDLNDYEDSPPLQTLTASGALTNTWFTLPPAARYSYNYHGLSQVLDHILVTPALLHQLVAFSPLHINADYPYAAYAEDGSVVWRAADHDPLAATFAITNEKRYTRYLPFVMR